MYFRKHLFFIFLALGCLLFLIKQHKGDVVMDNFIQIKKSSDLLEHIKFIPKNSLVLFDIDDTLIIPVSKTFTSKHKTIIDRIKKNKDLFHNYEEIISTWRLKRCIRLTDQLWPQVLGKLKKDFSVYALTKMDIGKVGYIPAIEKWRYKELVAFGLVFTNQEKNILNREGTSFYRGIIFTGKKSKSEALNIHIDLKKYTHIVMIDDRSEHLEDIQKYCQSKNVPFTGYLFQTMDVEIDDRIPEIQYKFLTEKLQWLEDEEALKMLG